MYTCTSIHMYIYVYADAYKYIYACIDICISALENQEVIVPRGGGLGSSTIFKNLMSPTPRRKWYLTTGRRAH